MHGGKNKIHLVLGGLSPCHRICLKLKGRLVPLRPIMSFRLICLKLVSLSRRIHFAISFKKGLSCSSVCRRTLALSWWLLTLTSCCPFTRLTRFDTTLIRKLVNCLPIFLPLLTIVTSTCRGTTVTSAVSSGRKNMRCNSNSKMQSFHFFIQDF